MRIWSGSRRHHQPVNLCFSEIPSAHHVRSAAPEIVNLAEPRQQWSALPPTQ